MDVQKELLSKKVGDLTANELLLLMKAFLRQTDSSTSKQDCHNDTESEEKPGNSNTQNNEEPHVIISLYSFIHETDPDYYLEHHRTASIVKNLLYRHSIDAEWLYWSDDPRESEMDWSIRAKINLDIFMEYYRNLPIKRHGFKKGRKIQWNNWGISCEEYLKHILTKRGFETQ